MNNLQQATERICELKGNLIALDALCTALLPRLSAPEREGLRRSFEACAEAARTAMLNAEISELSIAAFEADVARFSALVESLARRDAPAVRTGAESLLLAVPRVTTFVGPRALTGASGFFFVRDERCYLVTSRHVLIDEPSAHLPDRIELEFHADRVDLTRAEVLSLPLYRDGKACWRQAADTGGEIDVAVLPIDRAAFGAALPPAFTPAHLQQLLGEVDVGTPLLVVGFPLGFHDGLHHLPVARQAVVASSFGTRFQGQGMFLTDGRVHRGSSGSPVVMRHPVPGPRNGLPWKLLGIHSSRMDMGGRDPVEDESLGLNCAWYADVLLALTAS